MSALSALAAVQIPEPQAEQVSERKNAVLWRRVEKISNRLDRVSPDRTMISVYASSPCTLQISAGQPRLHVVADAVLP